MMWTEQALSYAEIKALCAGNPMIKEKMDLDIEVARLKVLKADHQSQQYRMEDRLLKYFPAEIERQKSYISGFEADLKIIEAHPQIPEGFCGIEIPWDTVCGKSGCRRTDSCCLQRAEKHRAGFFGQLPGISDGAFL